MTPYQVHMLTCEDWEMQIGGVVKVSGSEARALFERLQKEGKKVDPRFLPSAKKDDKPE